MRNNYSIDDDERRTVGTSIKLRPSHNKMLVELAKKEGKSKTYIIERALVAFLRAKK